jgi:methyl-accepting chemotaxis protein
VHKNNGSTIARKLAGGFGLCLFLLVVAGSVAVNRMNSMESATRQLVGESLTNIISLSKIVGDIKQYRIATLRLMTVTRPEDIAHERSMAETSADSIEHNYELYLANAKEPQDQQNIKELQYDWNEYYQTSKALIAAHDEHDSKKYQSLLGEAQSRWTPLRDLNDKMMDWNIKRSGVLSDAASESHRDGLRDLMIILSIAVLVNITLAVVITRTVSRSAADLTEVLTHASIAAENIATSSNQLASGNEDLASRTSEQAASLEETASSIEEITSLVQQSAIRAREANTLAVEAKKVAQTGGDVVGSAVRSMAEIEDSSKKISEIIGVIDDIAFQTNLLALNAAVEAARVGEQGKGFAVVASEVRSLAGRSATAAKEIKNLVQDSVKKVSEGTALVNKSGDELKEIVASVQSLTTIVAEISASSLEQEAGIEQVNKAIMQIDQITQENAALVEESATASGNLSLQAEDLKSLTSKFLGEDVSTPNRSLRLESIDSRKSDPAVRPSSRPSLSDTISKRQSARNGVPKLKVVGGKNSDHFEEF